MADQDLQIRGGGGLKKILFWPSGPHFGLKLSGGGGGGGGGALGGAHLDRHCGYFTLT